MDSSCFIEYAKGQLGARADSYSALEADMCRRILLAARNGDLTVYASALSVAEVLGVENIPPTEETKRFLTRLMMSGRDGVILVQPDPFIVEAARDLAWNHGIGKGAIDRIHLASALAMKCPELLTVDGVLARRIRLSTIEGCRLIPASQTALLPAAYRADDLFGNANGQS
jgi:predicted nucleic acid-binding protein